MTLYELTEPEQGWRGNDPERSSMSLAQDHAYRHWTSGWLGNVKRSVQKMEDALYHMHSQAVVDRQEVKTQFAMLFAKLSPLIGVSEEGSRQGTNTMAPPFQLSHQSSAPAPAAPRETEPIHLDLASTAHSTDPIDRSITNSRSKGSRPHSKSRCHGHAGSLPNGSDIHGTKSAGSEECQFAVEYQTEVDHMMPINPDLLVLQQQGNAGSHQAKTGEVRVLQSDGDAASFSIWHQQMIAYAYAHQSNLMHGTDLIASNFLQQRLKPKLAAQLIPDAPIARRRGQKLPLLTFGQQMGLLRLWFEPKEDGTSYVMKLKLINWDGRKEMLKDVVAQIMHVNALRFLGARPGVWVNFSPKEAIPTPQHKFLEIRVPDWISVKWARRPGGAAEQRCEALLQLWQHSTFGKKL